MRDRINNDAADPVRRPRATGNTWCLHNAPLHLRATQPADRAHRSPGLVGSAISRVKPVTDPRLRSTRWLVDPAIASVGDQLGRDPREVGALAASGVDELVVVVSPPADGAAVTEWVAALAER
jgi:hypothetical protein